MLYSLNCTAYPTNTRGRSNICFILFQLCKWFLIISPWSLTHFSNLDLNFAVFSFSVTYRVHRPLARPWPVLAILAQRWQMQKVMLLSSLLTHPSGGLVSSLRPKYRSTDSDRVQLGPRPTLRWKTFALISEFRLLLSLTAARVGEGRLRWTRRTEVY